MADVTLSKAVRANLLSLQKTAGLLGKTQERLATGLKVNSALDNATNFFTASSLSARAGDLGRLLDSVNSATQTLETANNGVTAITQLIETAQATARQALQTPGRVIQNEVVGSTSATYNPQALSVVNGDNTVAVPAGLTADAFATSTFTVGADRADGAVTLGGATAYGGDAILLNAAGSLQIDDTFTIEIDTGSGIDTLTVSFVAAGTGTTTVGGDATNATLSVQLDATLGNFRTAINTALDQLGGGTSSVIAGGAGSGNLTLTAEDASVGSIRVTGRDSGAALDASILTDLGFAATGTAIAGQAADRLITRNAAFDSLAAASDTLTVATGSGSIYTALGTITFGTGASAPKSLAELATAIDGLSATVSASVVGNNVVTSIANSVDFGTGLRFSQGAGDGTLAAFNLLGSDAGAVGDSGNVNQSTYNPGNLLTQGAVQQGDTIDIKIATHTTLTVRFGTGTGEVKSIAELNAALASLSGGAASVDSRGEINITTDKAQDSIVIGGTPTALTSFGLTAGETNNLLTATTGIVSGDQLNIQVGTNTLLSLTFGYGVNQISSFAELEQALDNLAGGIATIDADTGALTIEATTGGDTVTITSNDSLANPDDAVAEAFGLVNSTTPIQPTTVDSTVRAELESQFNVILRQISDIARDASFNGVNLLDGNDLSVIFNEDASSKLTISGVNFSYAGLGLSMAAQGYFQSDANVEATLDSLTAATDHLRAQASTFGANLNVVESRQDFTKRMINTLETGAANLTLADTNEEAANLLALQTRQQLSTTALSLASEADQNVLRLF
ncbi:MAG: hypothetical protein KKH72_14310 [Alphaproteobacteria bacterium]|nr:hypothetical protein [Alphaproteobacteria bacterium]